MPDREIRPLYSEEQAARMIGIKPRALRSEREAGRITFHKVGCRAMYDADDIAEWKEAIKCRDHRQARSLNGTSGEAASGTSHGRSKPAVGPAPGSVQRAQAIVQRLIESSRSGSKRAAPSSPLNGPAPVVPLRLE